MKVCDICGAPLDKQFVDGATRQGPWANMCMPCFSRHGRGLGIGRGQQYEFVPGVGYKQIAGGSSPGQIFYRESLPSEANQCKQADQPPVEILVPARYVTTKCLVTFEAEQPGAAPTGGQVEIVDRSDDGTGLVSIIWRTMGGELIGKTLDASEPVNVLTNDPDVLEHKIESQISGQEGAAKGGPSGPDHVMADPTDPGPHPAERFDGLS